MPPPMEGEEGPIKYVVASAALTMFTGPETLVFQADEEGNVTDWKDLDGSSRGHLDCDQAIRDAGYELVENRRHCNDTQAL